MHLAGANGVFQEHRDGLGPTPPGTGAMALALWAASSKATSPLRIRLPSAAFPTSFTPTSITTAPGFTQSPLTYSLTPAATTRMSARRQYALTSFVRVLVMLVDQL